MEEKKRKETKKNVNNLYIYIYSKKKRNEMTIDLNYSYFRHFKFFFTLINYQFIYYEKYKHVYIFDKCTL